AGSGGPGARRGGPAFPGPWLPPPSLQESGCCLMFPWRPAAPDGAAQHGLPPFFFSWSPGAHALRGPPPSHALRRGRRQAALDSSSSRDAERPRRAFPRRAWEREGAASTRPPLFLCCFGVVWRHQSRCEKGTGPLAFKGPVPFSHRLSDALDHAVLVQLLVQG